MEYLLFTLLALSLFLFLLLVRNNRVHKYLIEVLYRENDDFFGTGQWRRQLQRY